MIFILFIFYHNISISVLSDYFALKYIFFLDQECIMVVSYANVTYLVYLLTSVLAPGILTFTFTEVDISIYLFLYIPRLDLQCECLLGKNLQTASVEFLPLAVELGAIRAVTQRWPVSQRA